jgi:hypothetical protein
VFSPSQPHIRTGSVNDRARRAKARTRERSHALIKVATGLAVALAGVLTFVLRGTSGALPTSDSAGATISGPPGPEGVPLQIGPPLAPASTAATGQTIDGIACSAKEQVAYHVHTHVSVYANGVLRALPAGVGIVHPVAQQTDEGPFYGATSCYYWLHVHAPDGVIHIESPSTRNYTLGEFFDIWRQPLTTTEVGSVRGRMTIYVNGRLYRGNPRNIALSSHEDIQIDVGAPVVAPAKVEWAATGL